MDESIMDEPIMNQPIMKMNTYLVLSKTVTFTFLLGYVLSVFFLAHQLYVQARVAARVEAQVEVQAGAQAQEGEDKTEAQVQAQPQVDVVPYESQYFKQLDEMPDKLLDTDELAVIGENVLIEDTPKGQVYMLYNTGTETFDYYTDKVVDITYEMLDTVARLFAITFRCKQICVNYKEELQKGERNMLSEIEFDQLKKELAEKNLTSTTKERSVFAAYKSYNKKTGNNVEKKYYILTEKANRFKYKGKISEYEQSIKKKTDEESTLADSIKISYSEFKRLQQEQLERENAKKEQ
jgi:hypothetical protein